MYLFSLLRNVLIGHLYLSYCLIANNNHWRNGYPERWSFIYSNFSLPDSLVTLGDLQLKETEKEKVKKPKPNMGDLRPVILFQSKEEGIDQPLPKSCQRNSRNLIRQFLRIRHN